MPTESYTIEANLTAKDDLTGKVKSALEAIQNLKRNGSGKLKLNADTDEAQRAIESYHKMVQQLPKKAETVLSAQDRAGEIVKNLHSRLDEINGKTVKTNLDADDSNAQSKIEDVNSRLRGLDSQTAEPTVEVNSQEAQGQLDDVKSRLDEVTNTDAKPSVSLNDNVTGPLEKIIQLLTNIEQTVYAVVDLQDNASGPLSNIESMLDNLEQEHTIPVEVSGAEQVQQQLTQTSSIWDTLKNSMVFTAGQNIFHSLASGIPEFIQGAQDSSVAMDNLQTVLTYFNRNNHLEVDTSGLTKAQEAAETSIKDYASKTIYSTIDMMQAYGQLTGAGVENADKLVEAFGNIAASSANPKQAMQTIMTQMTQMAANGKADWADMKLLFEQAGTLEPQVAKELGMSVADMQDAMSKGKISAQDMFDALEKAASAGGGVLEQAAQSFHTIPQALDGISEDIQHKLLPVFDSIQSVGIEALTGLNQAIDNSGLGDSFENLGKAVTDFFNGFKETGAMDTIDSDIEGVMNDIANFNNSLSSDDNAETWGENIGNAVNTISSAFSTLQPILDQVISSITNFGNTLAGIKIGNTNLRDIGITAIAAMGGIGLLAGKISDLKTKFDGFKGLNPFKNMFNNMSGSMNKAENDASSGSGIIGKIFSGLGKLIEGIGTVIGTTIANMFKPFDMLSAGSILKGAAAIGVLELALAGLGAMRDLIHPLFQDLIDGISELVDHIGPQLPNLGTAFERLGNGIKSALDGVGDIIKSTFDGVADIIESAGDAAEKAGNGFDKMSDGAQKLSNVDFGNLAANLAVLTGANGINSLVDVFNKWAGTDMGTIAKQLDSLADAAQKLSQASGVGKVLDSIKSFKMDSGQIKSAADAIKKLSDNMKGLDTGNKGNTFSGMTSSLRSASTQIQQFTTRLKTLKTTMNGLGGGKTNTFASLTSSLKSASTQMNQLTTRTRTLKTALNGLGGGKTNTFASLTSSLKSASTQIQQFTTHVRTLKTAMAQIGGTKSNPFSSLTNNLRTASTQVSQFTTRVNALKTALNGLGGGKTNPFAGMAASMSQIKSQANGVVTSLNSIKTAVAGIGVGKGFAGIAAQLNSLGVAARNAGNAIATGLNSGLSRMTTMVGTAVSAAVARMNAGASQMGTAGGAMGNRANQGFANGARAMVQTAVSAVSAAVHAMSAGASAAYSAGAAIGSGLANGLWSQLGAVQAAAAAISAAADAAIREKNKIASPSKVQYENGRFMGQGLVNGLLSMSGDVKKAAVSMAGISLPALAVDGASVGYQMPNMNITLHSDVYLDSEKVGYGVAKPVKDKNDADARFKNRLDGVR